MFGKIRIYKAKKILRVIPVHQDTSPIIQTPFRPSRHLLDHPDTFHIIRTPFRSSGYILDHPDTFHIIIKTLFGSSGDFLDHPVTLQIIPILLDHPDTLHIILIVLDHPDTSGFHTAGQPAKPFRICKNSQVSIDEALAFLTLNPLKTYMWWI